MNYKLLANSGIIVSPITIHIGHFSMEKFGMKYAVGCISELSSHEVPVHFVRFADMYEYA